MYDLVNDPTEMSNLYDSPEHQPQVAKLKAELERLQREVGDDPSDVGDNPRTGAAFPTSVHAKSGPSP